VFGCSGRFLLFFVRFFCWCWGVLFVFFLGWFVGVCCGFFFFFFVLGLWVVVWGVLFFLLVGCRYPGAGGGGGGGCEGGGFWGGGGGWLEGAGGGLAVGGLGFFFLGGVSWLEDPVGTGFWWEEEGWRGGGCSVWGWCFAALGGEAGVRVGSVGGGVGRCLGGGGSCGLRPHLGGWVLSGLWGVWIFPYAFVLVFSLCCGVGFVVICWCFVCFCLCLWVCFLCGPSGWVYGGFINSLRAGGVVSCCWGFVGLLC